MVAAVKLLASIPKEPYPAFRTEMALYSLKECALSRMESV